MLLVLIASPAFASSHDDCAVEGACCFPRTSLQSPRVREPRLATIAAFTIAVGPLRRPAVKRVLGERAAALGACTTGKAEARAHLVISPAGVAAISNVVATPQVGHPAEAEPLARCATEALRTAVFPPTTGVTELDVRITW